MTDFNAIASDVACEATAFDYDALDVETRIVVQQKTGEIKERMKRTPALVSRNPS